MRSHQAIIEIDSWIIGQRIPTTPEPHPVIVLLHGWTGDENSMRVFMPKLPRDALLLAPRGLYPTPLGGYGWHTYKPDSWPWVDDFQSAIEALINMLTPENFPGGDFTQFSLVGFSQGAALSYAFSLEHPWLVSRIAGLSGFMPEGAVALARNLPLQDKPIFIAHGTLDTLVPVERARQAASILQLAGASVSYCEEEVGHKLSASCFRGLENYFSKANP